MNDPYWEEETLYEYSHLSAKSCSLCVILATGLKVVSCTQTKSNPVQ